MKEFTAGVLYLAMGAKISLISTKQCKLRGLTVKTKSRVTITSALGKDLDIMRTATITVTLEPKLEIDIGYVAVSSGDLH